MKNLENYGVQELSAQEKLETDGGFLDFVLGLVAGVIISFVAKAIRDNKQN